jgi:penicillin-binding protein 1C
MVNALVDADFKGVSKRRADLGLSLALGGCDASLFELVGLYAALANEGKYAQLSFLAKKDTLHEKRLLSAEATYMTTEILSLLKRPDYPNGYEHAQGVPKVAWKTGTSYGKHDAWSIGYTPKYTIGVWVGNASGEANAQLVGAQAAAPLLFDLFNALERGKAEAWFKRPSKLATRKVCAISGKPAQSWCTEHISDTYIPLVSSNEKCTHLAKAFVANDGSCTYCFACMPPIGAKEVLLPNISGELQAYYQLQHIAYEQAPPHNANCPSPPQGGAPAILSLGEGRAYLMPDADSPLSLLCRASTPKVYWYANGDFIGEAASLQAFLWKPKRGKIEIDCVDALGRKASIRIQVL